MLRRLRNNFGIPGILAIGGLVFAMIGGAYPASGDGGGKATASAKKGKTGKRGPRGPRGFKGAAGPAGPAGPQGPAGPGGPAGAKGDAGAKGADGADGDPGADGTGVKVTKLEPLLQEECEKTGGALVEEDTPGGEVVEVCNGEQGEDGEKGQPWVPENVLPEGATLVLNDETTPEAITGLWLNGVLQSAGTYGSSLSGPIG